MAAATRLSLADLQKGLAKTPERANYQTIAGRALSGIDPRYLGGFDPVQYQSTFNNLYDNLSTEFASQDLGLGQLYNDYETQYGRLGDDEGVANRKLMNAMANRGTLSSGSYLDESENVAGDFNRMRGDLGSNLQKGFTDAAARRLQAIGGYNTGLAQQELGLGQSARGYAQSAAQAEAQAARDAEYQRQQTEANQAYMAQQQAAIDARLQQQAEYDASTRAWQESERSYQDQLWAAMQMNQAAQQPQQPQWTGPPIAASPAEWKVGMTNPAIFQPGYTPQIKSNPATAPMGGSGSFSGYMQPKTGSPISPGYKPRPTGFASVSRGNVAV